MITDPNMMAEMENDLAVREEALLQREEEIRQREEIAESWRPFVPQIPLDNIDLQHLSSMTPTLKGAVKKLKDNLQSALSSQSLRFTGMQHYRFMWMASGAQMLYEVIERQSKDSTVKAEQAQKKDMQDFVEKKARFENRTMMSIYDPQERL